MLAIVHSEFSSSNRKVLLPWMMKTLFEIGFKELPGENVGGDDGSDNHEYDDNNDDHDVVKDRTESHNEDNLLLDPNNDPRASICRVVRLVRDHLHHTSL